MENETKKHHDYRKHIWNISLNEEEYAIADAKRRESGLTKARYGRNALMYSTVLSRLSPNDLEQVTRVSRIHAEINQIATVLNKLNRSGSPDANDSLMEYVYKVREQIDHIEDSIVNLDNYLKGKTGGLTY